MNISKFIAKLVLAFFVFSAVPIQGPILAGSQEIESPDLIEQNRQQNGQYNELRERRKWKYMFASVACLALSASFLRNSYADCRSGEYVTGIAFGFYGCFCAAGGAGGMYNFLKARLLGR